LSRFSRFAWLVVAWNVLVIVEGAFVRATGSGAGCGDHWPLCNGKLVIGSPSTATLIEYAHRSMTGIDSLLVLAMTIWGFRIFPKKHPVRFGIKLSLFFLVMEAILGALLVKLRLVVNDESVMRAVFLSIHLANTLTLMACLTLTAWWSDARARVPARRGGWSMLAAVAATGIAGALAALADTLHPATSLAAGLAQDFDPNASLLVRLRE
jgi:heme A synthase